MKKVMWTIGLSSVVLASSHAFAGQIVNETLPASSKSFIKIDHVNGTADIKGWDRDEVKVEGELGDKTDEFTFRQRGDDIIIEVEVESRYGGWKNWSRGDGDDLTIFIPHGASVSYESINANASFDDIAGKVEVEVVNGNIDLKALTGRTRVDAVNGSIDIKGVTGELTVETVNGSIDGEHTGSEELTVDTVNGTIRVKSQSDEIRAETVNGDIELELDRVNDLEMTSVNGDIEVTMHLVEGGEVQASTVGGRIELAFQKDVSARFDIEAHAGGRISNGITQDKMQKAKYGPRRWLNFSTGSGASQVELSTVSGKIEVDVK